MKFIGGKLYFPSKDFHSNKTYSVIWFCIIKFCHFYSSQIIQYFFIFRPMQRRHLYMVNRCRYPEIGDFGSPFWSFLKNSWKSFVFFCITFNISSLACSRSLFHFVLNMFHCFFLYYFSIGQAQEGRCCLEFEAPRRSGLLGVSKDRHLGTSTRGKAQCQVQSHLQPQWTTQEWTHVFLNFGLQMLYTFN